MAGYQALSPGESTDQVQSALNAMNSEQYGAMAQAFFTVANQAALSAIPSYYQVVGKLVRVMDADGLGTTLIYSWSGSAWIVVPSLLQTGVAVASAASIAPTGDMFHITGTAQINTITGGSNGRKIVIIPDGIFTFGTSGNIAIASTAVVGRNMTLVFDGVTGKWYASY